jgi:hypothetical protein
MASYYKVEIPTQLGNFTTIWIYLTSELPEDPKVLAQCIKLLKLSDGKYLIFLVNNKKKLDSFEQLFEGPSIDNKGTIYFDYSDESDFQTKTHCIIDYRLVNFSTLDTLWTINVIDIDKGNWKSLIEQTFIQKGCKLLLPYSNPDKLYFQGTNKAFQKQKLLFPTACIVHCPLSIV